LNRNNKHRFVVFIGTLALVATARAESPRVYQPAGAPADVKVSARWNYYRDYAQATGLLKQIAAAHPEICRLESLGTSFGGREMWVLTITNQAKGDEAAERRRPAMWIDGGIHANEVQAVDVVLYTAWYLTESYGRNEFVTRLIDERAFYLMPMMSPDSRDAHMYSPNTTNSPRGGQRPVDDDRDGQFDEDPADDLDGDGSITQMRVRDPLGRWKEHNDYPQLMVRTDADEAGGFRLLGSEGIDNDKDGRVNEDDSGYYDPNRDWAWQWQPGYVQRGAYRYPFSVPENRMVADFVMAHPNIAGGQSYHNTGGLILRGPGSNSDRWPGGDIRVFDQLAKRGEEILPGYRYIVTGEELYEVWGGETDWLYAMQGVFAFTNELNTPFNLFRKSGEGGQLFAGDTDRKLFEESLLMGDGFVEWHEVEHPQYGKVEVGGFKKNWGRQPPSFLLEEECHRNMAFTLWHADQMPSVEIVEFKARRLDDGMVELTATLLNRKLTPTRSSMNVQKGITRPDLATLSSDNEVTVLAALEADEPDFLQARDIRQNPAELRIDSLDCYSPVYVRWLVKGDGPWKITLDSIKGGRATATAKLE
jgi:hypothetical protein